MPARRRRPPSSACRWVSSARRNRRRRWPPMGGVPYLDRAWPAWRQRHGGGGGQRAGERRRMTSARSVCAGVGPGDPELHDGEGGAHHRHRAGGGVFRQARPCGPCAQHRRRPARCRVPRSCASTIRSPPNSRSRIRATSPRWAPFTTTCAEQLAARLRGGQRYRAALRGRPVSSTAPPCISSTGSARIMSAEVVPGVTGMSGCWSRAGLPMTHGDDVLSVLPAHAGRGALANG